MKKLIHLIPEAVYHWTGVVVVCLIAIALILFIIYWLMIIVYGGWLKLNSSHFFNYYIKRKCVPTERIREAFAKLGNKKAKNFKKFRRVGAKYRLRNIRDLRNKKIVWKYIPYYKLKEGDYVMIEGGDISGRQGEIRRICEDYCWIQNGNQDFTASFSYVSFKIKIVK